MPVAAAGFITSFYQNLQGLIWRWRSEISHAADQRGLRRLSATPSDGRQKGHDDAIGF
jgi:hypothetical protein